MTEVEGIHDNSNTEIEQLNQKRIKLNERRGGIKLEVGFGNILSLVLRKNNCSNHLANIYKITQEQEEPAQYN
ncbi:hypothetical protein GLOIN_2v1489122 [Rhizophagus irregularis DAOM 181602=DAOM 197198]|nr:hypothetical protein GLOIN_2v1489122 [Rhizophagus irregularis DAOM 181602=DAOM 197198]